MVCFSQKAQKKICSLHDGGRVGPVLNMFFFLAVFCDCFGSAGALGVKPHVSNSFEFFALLQSCIWFRIMGCCIYSDAIPFDVELTLEEFELLLELHMWFALQDF